MSGELNFYMHDLYGHNYGAKNTRAESLPEAEDQMALVDSQETAVKQPVDHDPQLSKNILIGIGIFAIIVVAFSIV